MATLGFIDFIVDIITNNVSLDFEELIENIIQFTIKNPFNSFITSIVLIPLFAILLYSFIERAADFVTKISNQETRRKNKTIITLVLSTSTFFSILFVHNMVQGKAPRPEFVSVNNQKITQEQEKVIIVNDFKRLKWQYDLEAAEKTQHNKNFGYAVQFSDNKHNFAKPSRQDFNKKNFKDITKKKSTDPPSKFYWKVTPGYLREKDKQFIQTNPSSKLLKIDHYGSILSKIATDKKIKVCTSRSGEKSFLSYEDENSALGLQGLEVELINKITNSIIVDSSASQEQYWIPKDVRDLVTVFRKIGRGECDLAISSLSITKDREKKHKLKFSLPYYETNLALIINQKRHDELIQDQDRVDLLQLLSGKTVGVLQDSTSAKTIEIFNKLLSQQAAQLINPKIVTEVSDGLLNLDSANPTVDFVLADEVYAESFIAKNKQNLETLYDLQPNLYPAGFPPQLIGENYGIAVNYRASDLLEKINQIIKNLDQSGQLKQMIEKHKSHYDDKN